MTALIAGKMSSFEKWGQKQFTLAAGLKAWKNGACGILPGTSTVSPMTQTAGMLYIGKFYEDMDATLGAKLVNVDLDMVNVDWFVNNTVTPVAATDFGALCYFVDDTTVQIAPGGGSVAGRVWGVDALKGVAVQRLTGAGAGGGGGVQSENILPAFAANNIAAPVAAGVFDIPTTGAASTVTLSAAAAEGTIQYFVADGIKNGHTVQYRDATGPVLLTTALTALKRHPVIATFLNGLWYANAYVAREVLSTQPAKDTTSHASTHPYVSDGSRSRMQTITENEYNRLNSALWWQKLAKTRTSTGRRDVIPWLLSTAMIKDQGKGGNIAFDDLVSTFTEIENKFSGAGLELGRAQLEDTDGGGMDLAAQWSSDIGAYMSYWPQKQTVALLKTGHLASVAGYDKQIFFSQSHPVNPFNVSAGNYANLLTGAPVAAVGNTPAYPGTLPLDESVTVDVALTNMSKLFSYIASIKMPNGEDPRYLRPAFILVPPKMFPRLVQISNAKFIAQAAAGGAAVGDVEALIRALGFAQPVMADELPGFEGDTTYYVVCQQVNTTQLGGIIYTEREPFRINYYSNVDQVELSRKQKLEWHCIGRNVVSPGHPYLVIKGKGS